MASTKLAYMPQDSNNSIIPQYFPDPNLRSQPSKSGLWSSAPLNSPQQSNGASSSVWGSPLSVLTSNSHSLNIAQPLNSAPPLSSGSGSGIPRAMRTSSTGTVADFPVASAPQSLAALSADSEPVASRDIESYTQPMSSASSRLSSRQSSLADPTSPKLSTPTPGTSPVPSNSSVVGGNSVSGGSGSAVKGQGSGRTANDEIINTAIVVKNIPFAIKKEQLIDFMTQLGLPLPYAFNYHFDNGVFRGLAFANFTSADETTEVISTLNGRELGGRKLRVEYKKMLPYQERERIEREKRERRGQLEEQHQKSENAANAYANNARPNSVSSLGSVGSVGSPGSHPSAVPLRSLEAHQIDMNDSETLKLYMSLLLFKRDTLNSELLISPSQMRSIAPEQLGLLSALSEQLDLTCGYNEELGIVISKSQDSSDDQDSYFTGILRYAVAIPSASPSLPTSSTAHGHVNKLNQGYNRWNGFHQ